MQENVNNQITSILIRLMARDISSASLIFSLNTSKHFTASSNSLLLCSGKKKLEYYYKRLKYNGTSMSCVPPEVYAERFIRFLTRDCIKVVVNIKKKR
jgi:hypothetical protein